MKSVLLCSLTAAVLASSGHAQLVTSLTRPLFSEGPATLDLVDVNTGSNTLLYDALAPGNELPGTVPGFGGLAADDVNRRLFASTRNGSSESIYSFDYATNTPTFLFDTTNSADGGAISFDGLAYDSNRSILYATRRLSIGVDVEGLYQIDLNTGSSTLVFNWEDITGSSFFWDVTAIDYDASSDTLYFANEDSDDRSLYSLDAGNVDASNVNFLASFDDGVTDVDGLGAGDGKLYLVTDNADVNNGQHSVYNVLTGQYEDPIDSIYPPRSGNFAGQPINPSGAGAYSTLIPAPGSLAALGMAGLAAARRRRG